MARIDKAERCGLRWRRRIGMDEVESGKENGGANGIDGGVGGGRDGVERGE